MKGVPNTIIMRLSICLITIFTALFIFLITSLEVNAETTLKNPTVDDNGDGTTTTTWDLVYFGHYPQSEYTPINPPNNPIEGDIYTDTDGSRFVYAAEEDANPTHKYFLVEPIRWRVLSVNDDDIFLLSDKSLDAKRYNETCIDITWEKSTIRSYLNGYDSSHNTCGIDYTSDNFMNAAFNSQEKGFIKSTTISNSDSYYADGGNDTTDKVYFLSVDEIIDSDFGFGTISDEYDAAKTSRATEYTKYRGAKTENFTGSWWLRSPGYLQSRAAVINYYGEVIKNGPDVDGNAKSYASSGFGTYGRMYTIRPVLHLKSTSALWNSFEKVGTISSDGTERYCIDKEKISLSNTSYIYNGAAKKPSVTIEGLTKDADYTVIYKNSAGKTVTSPISAGNYTVIITGKGNYTGTTTKSFTIKPKSISTATLSFNSTTYNGKVKHPSVTVKSGDTTVASKITGDTSKVYLTYASGRKYPGQYNVTIKGKGNYTGTITKTFTIKSPSVKATSKVYARLVKGDYDAIYASWNKVAVTGATVKYKVQYKVGSNAWKTAKISGTSNNYCTLKGLTDGQKCYIKVTPYVTVNKKSYYAVDKNSAAVYTLKKLNRPTIKKAASTKVKISWNNINGETGYEVYKSSKKSSGFKLVKTIKSTTAKSTTLKVIKNKKYYYKVRAYKTINISGKYYKVYGPMSDVNHFILK